MHVRNRLMDGRTKRLTMAGVILIAVLASGVAAQSASPHHGFLGGPWEVLVKMGHEGVTMRMPLSIADENRPQELDAVIPVMGTPIKVKLERYLPNLAREMTAVEDPNGGPIARLSLRGENLEQDLWLCARDRERQSISAHIGSVVMRELPAPDGTRILQELTDPDVVGVLFVWLAETGSESPTHDPALNPSPRVYAVKPGRAIALAGSPWKLSVLRYVPHYSIDRQTKEVTSASDQPENPALEIRVEGDGQEHRQWLWSQFAASPHGRRPLPFRARFVDFHSAGAGRYILTAVQDSQPHLLYLRNGKKCVEPVELGKRYPFDDERYSFGVEEVRFGARIETTWKNASEVLLRPAVLATISESQSSQQVVLELGQPCHQKTASGTLVVLYRRAP